MGYLTTITIRNDCLDALKKHPQEFADRVYDACTSMEGGSFPLGHYCNPVEVQRCRHADDHTTYVHMGNTITEVNPFSKDFEQLAERCPEFADRLVRFLEDEVKRLKKYKLPKKTHTP